MPNKQLVDKYRPISIDQFVGIETPRAIMTAFVANPYSSSWLFLGESGTGKTTLAFAVAFALGARQEIGGGIYHIPARACDLETIDKVVHLCYMTPMIGAPFNIVIIDEGDQMTRAAQLRLLSNLDSSDPPPNTIWFITLNDLTNLEVRFRSRCKLLEFDTKGLLDPGIDLLSRIWRAESPKKAKTPDFAAMMRDSQCNLREALNLLETEILCPGTFRPRSIAVVHKHEGRIFTIGYSGLKREEFREIIETLRITKLVDCRLNPRTDIPGFSGAELERCYPDRYNYAGAKLGRNRVTEAGLGWLVTMAEDGERVMLLANERPPGRSHRYSEIAIPLLTRGIDCLHVCEEELITTSQLKQAIEMNRAYDFSLWRDVA